MLVIIFHQSRQRPIYYVCFRWSVLFMYYSVFSHSWLLLSTIKHFIIMFCTCSICSITPLALFVHCIYSLIDSDNVLNVFTFFKSIITHIHHPHVEQLINHIFLNWFLKGLPVGNVCMHVLEHQFDSERDIKWYHICTCLS